TATDLVLTVTQMLRQRGVVGKFVEFYGHGLDSLPLADRATIGNMSPEYGATCGIFPVDAETLAYLRLTGRPDAQVKRVEAYCKEQGLIRPRAAAEAMFLDRLALELGKVEPSLAGPSRPQDRVPLHQVKKSFFDALPSLQVKKSGAAAPAPAPAPGTGALKNGSVVIAAITSCTNTSNPSVMLGAGILAEKAAQRGLQTKPRVQ